MDDYLAHVGRSKLDGAPIGSGRYRIGSGENPRAGKTRSSLRLFQKKDKLVTEESVETPKESSDERKERIIKTGNVKDAYKYRTEFSNEELDKVITRYEKEQKVKKLTAPENVKTGQQKLNDMSKFLESSVKITSSGIAIYNNVARTMNSLVGTNLSVIKGLDKFKMKKEKTDNQS